MNEGKPTQGPASPFGDAGGGYEPDRSAAARSDAASSEGDFELRRPEDVAEGTVSAAPASAEESGSVPAAGVAPDAPPAAEKPLHDPDPYSTPPYGEPGPWAPAPPVQHPAATPANGTGIPAATPANGTAIPRPLRSTACPRRHRQPPCPAPRHPRTAPRTRHRHLGTGSRSGRARPAHAGPVPGRPRPPRAPASAPAPGASAPTPAPSRPPRPEPPTAHPHQPLAPLRPLAAAAARPGAAPTPAPLQQTGAAVLTQEQRHRRGMKVLLVGVVLVALVSGGVGGAVGAYLERNGGVGEVELPQAGKEPAGRAADSVAGIAARALPSVVTLHVSGAEAGGTGTGFVLDDRGHILTNNHVVEPAGDDGEITVTFHSGDTAKAEVVGRDGGYDLAVVRVRGVSGLEPLPLGNSDNVQVGDPVVAIGAPFDLAGTVTSGIISAKERPITAGGESGDGSDVSYVDALQTDAPINPGNSGGPLLDAQARVIGINSAIRSADSGSDLDGGQAGSIGLGFAIPVNQGKRVAEELISTGKATHPVIGVTLDMNYTGDGARVGTKGNDGGPPVTRNGPGDKAGIEAGDVITEVDGQRIHSGEELIVKTRAHRPGDRLQLTVVRDGKERTISLELGSSDGD
ncbi:trypsin-like peptidase domain-containing protein [Streptomyces sp. F001]|uniref:trypsin-like peptidase domain-containing protein n=1 Tax=Streptomyces sp. F001 TaxID=1510026 RepID=UPI001F0EBFFE|nr:trypsin-like peptidase domain-containing protein [Streptomyces sp. F001]